MSARILKLWAAAALVLVTGCQSRADLEEGRYYRCDPSAGAFDQQCPGGWTCTQEGFCQDPAVGAALRCDTSADCTGGWHCGVEGRCYDRATVTDVKCRQEDPEDCAPGWRCGLEGVCHDSTQAAAYQCQDDSWCEQGWRCGSEGVCVDSRGEALRPRSGGALRTERISPTYPLSAEEVAGSGWFTMPDFDDKDVHVLRADGGVWIGTWDQGLGVAAQRLEVPGATRVAAVGPWAFYLDGAGLHRVDTTDGLFSPPETIDLAGLTPVTGLRAMADFRNALAVFSGNKIGFVAAGASAVSAITTFPAGANVLDVADVSERSGSGPSEEAAYGIVAATQAGLYVAYQSTDGTDVALPTTWRPLSVPGLSNTACGAAPSSRPTRIRGIWDWWTDSWRVAVELTPLAGGRPQVMVLERAPGAYPGSDCPASEFTSVVAPTDPCPGAALSDFDVTDEAEVVARCRSSATELTSVAWLGDDGGTQLSTSGASWWDEPMDLPTTGSASNPVRVVQDPSGRLGECDTTTGYYSCAWAVTDRPPLGVIRMEDAGYGVVTVDWDYDFSLSEYYAYPILHEPSALGLRPRWYGLAYQVERPADAVEPLICSFPRGSGDHVGVCIPGEEVALYDVDELRGSFSYNEYPQPRAVLTGSAFAVAQAARRVHLPAETAPLPDGGQLLLMAVGDALWAGPPTPGNPDAGPARLSPRMAPLPRGEITSVAVSTPRPEGPLVEAYVIAQERVYRVEARSEQQWFSEAIALPAGTPSAVWTDAQRGRAGFTDGRVYSLPAGVQIGAPIPGGEVLDYAVLCGHGYALTRNALYTLAPNLDGGAIGAWQPVDLSASGLPPQGQLFYGWHEGWAPYFYLPDYPAPDRLIAAEGELLLFTEAGAMLRFKDTECDPD